MQTVVVIGSNSFSGGDFVDLLLEQSDHRVVGVSRSPEKSSLFLAYRGRPKSPRFEFHALDLNRDADAVEELLARERPAYVVNFASQSEVAPSWDAPEQWFQTNAVAVARLVRFLEGRSWLERYVHISTPEVYGSCEGLVVEDAPFAPSTPYAASRAAGEYAIDTFVAQYGFPAVKTRAANVYGAHQQLFKIVPRTAIYVRLGRPLELHGGGTQRRSFIHIRDVSRATLAAMERGENGAAYNLATDENVAIRDLVRSVCEHSGASFEAATRSGEERPGQDAAYLLDSTRARTRLDWAPRVTLDEGIAEVVAWITREWDRVVEQPLEYVHQR